MAAVFFSSDHHFAHANIIRYCNRPFESVQAMNREMIRRWNDVVEHRDVVYHLGDFAMGDSAHWHTFCKKLNGRKILVRGNHDKGVERMLQVGFNEVHENIVCEIDGARVWMNHYPFFSNDERDLRRPEPPSEYDIALCGHIHEKWKLLRGCVNVGVDVWDFRPITLDDIRGALA